MPLAQMALQCVLAGGDDYELVFTARPAQRAVVQAASAASATPVTRIGQIDAEPGLRLVDALGQPVANTYHSFNHFSA
jgi:thiamine-monophosphate kinase